MSTKFNPQAQDTSQTRSTPTVPPPQTYRQIAATHIATLSEINAQLPKLLTYFAACISQPTSTPIEIAATKHKPDTVLTREESIFYMSYYIGQSLGLIREQLLKQVADLERYGVISEKGVRFGAGEEVRNGGYGEFDVGVLNARVGAGQGGGGEVMERLEGVVGELARRSGLGEEGGMDVDG